MESLQIALFPFYAPIKSRVLPNLSFELGSTPSSRTCLSCWNLPCLANEKISMDETSMVDSRLIMEDVSSMFSLSYFNWSSKRPLLLSCFAVFVIVPERWVELLGPPVELSLLFDSIVVFDFILIILKIIIRSIHHVILWNSLGASLETRVLGELKRIACLRSLLRLKSHLRLKFNFKVFAQLVIKFGLLLVLFLDSLEQ